MSVKETLQRAKQYIEQGWTQKANARLAYGKEVNSLAPDAVSWCIGGAISRAMRCDEDYQTRWAFSAFVPNKDIVAWNDAPERTKEEVLAKFDEVIASIKDDV